MNKKVGIGLIGYGYWGPNFARILSKIENVDFLAIVDVSEISRAKALSGFKVPILDNFQDLLSNKKLDGVVIATPPNTHDDLLEKVLESGKNVLIEKPMSLDLTRAKKARDIARNRDLVLMPGHTFIFNPAIEAAKNIIDDGQIGNIEYIYSQRLNLGQVRRDVDVFWNLAPHDISISNYLMTSYPVSINATSGHITNSKLADVGFMSMKYPNGVISHHHLSWLDPTKTRKVTIIGSKGMLIIDDVSPDFKLQIHKKFIDKKFLNSANSNSFQSSIRSGDIIILTWNLFNLKYQISLIPF